MKNNEYPIAEIAAGIAGWIMRPYKKQHAKSFVSVILSVVSVYK